MSQEPSFSHRFVAEAREHLAVMTSAMISLERDADSPQAAVEQLLRAAHSIKGGAAFTGRRNIEHLAHVMEEAIENIRDGVLNPHPEVVDALLAVLDKITALVDDFDHSDESDISDAIARLKSLVDTQSPQSQEPTVPVLSRTEDADSLSSSPLSDPAQDFILTNQVLSLWRADSSHLYGVKLDWFECERQFGLSPSNVAERLERAGHVLESRTDVTGRALSDGLPLPPMWLMSIVSSSLEMKDFSENLGIPCAQLVQLRAKTAVAESAPPPSADNRARVVAGAPSLRVSVPLVDKMMALAGELVLVRNQAMRSVDTANSPLRRLLRRLDSVTNELQDAALRIRTQPVGTLFDRFPRVVRDLSRQLGKEITIEIKGSDVELDKTVLELLTDPLTHLIRNCCDHGIESPQQRVKSGKPPSGVIKLSARQERGQIVIEVRDDGRGIDATAIKQKALDQGVKREDELARLSARQVYDLILLSGFSTASQVTDVSGRGVGMDVVKTNLDQVGGVVEIDSAIGKGTVFTLRMPLTLAIMPCLLLGSDGNCYGVPQRDVEEILLIDRKSERRGIERNHEGEVLRWRGRLLSVIRLREVLSNRKPVDAETMAEIASKYHQPESGMGRIYAAVLRSGSHRFVLVFDEVLGSENIVVKPLHPLLRPLGIYAATTILGEGNVALILNSEGVARHGGILDRPAVEETAATPNLPAAKQQSVLKFRFGSAELLAVAMSAVRRVVMITPDQIARIGPRELVKVDGSAINLIRLDTLINLSACKDSSHLFLILPRDESSSAGLLVSEIVDTQIIPMELDERALQADGVLGTTMIQGEIAILLDFNRIIRMWEQLQRAPRPALPESAERKILVVDDTQFFQKLISEYLRSEGHHVTVAANGSEGLAKLQGARFDLVVCDIEMPVMDGLELARRVRQQPDLAAIPMVALTTLSTPQSRANAMNSGFDAYEIKLDRQTLSATVNGLLERGRRPALTNSGAPTDA